MVVTESLVAVLSPLLLGRLGLLFLLDLRHVLLYLVHLEHPHLLALLQHGHLQILAALLHHLQQRSDGQLHRALLVVRLGIGLRLNSTCD